MKYTPRQITAVLVSIIVSFSLFAAACAPGTAIAPAVSPEPTPTATATPTATPTPSPSPTPTPEPYFDLENMTDEELLSVYGIPNEGTILIGYSTDNSGLDIVEYVVDDITCITIVGMDTKGNKRLLRDYPLQYNSKKVLITTDDQIYSDVSLGTINEKNFDNAPFPGELIIGENEVKNVMIIRAIPLFVYYRYLKLQGLSVPETKWSQDIEGVEMCGNVVSILGMLRYFLTLAPHDEVMNHIKLNYPETAKIITEEP